MEGKSPAFKWMISRGLRGKGLFVFLVSFGGGIEVVEEVDEVALEVVVVDEVFGVLGEGLGVDFGVEIGVHFVEAIFDVGDELGGSQADVGREVEAEVSVEVGDGVGVNVAGDVGNFVGRGWGMRIADFGMRIGGWSGRGGPGGRRTGSGREFEVGVHLGLSWQRKATARGWARKGGIRTLFWLRVRAGSLGGSGFPFGRSGLNC